MIKTTITFRNEQIRDEIKTHVKEKGFRGIGIYLEYLHNKKQKEVK